LTFLPIGGLHANTQQLYLAIFANDDMASGQLSSFDTTKGC